jgi:hypothetical protein
MPPELMSSLPGDPFDGSGPKDPNCDAIRARRDDFGRILWLFGDSMLRGFALKRFPDQVVRSKITREPLWPLRSPASMINFATHETMDEDAFGVVRGGEYVACYAGSCGQPGEIAGAVWNLTRMRASRMFRKGDAVVFLDAGYHTSDPDLYQEQWTSVIGAAREESVSLILCTACDNLETDEREVLDGMRKRTLMYDVPWPGAAGQRSINEATRAAAHQNSVILLDIAETSRELHKTLQFRYASSAYLDDNIHLNIWGQLCLAVQIHSTAWPHLALDLAPVERLVRAHFRRVAFYSGEVPNWSPDLAVELARMSAAFSSRKSGAMRASA